MRMITKIYDTSSLLLANDIFSTILPNEKIAITSITLQELEKIKTSANKDTNIKYSAR